MFGVDSVDGLYIDTETIPQIFEYSFVLHYSNTIYAIQLFVLQPCGFAYALFVRPIGVGMHIIDDSPLSETICYEYAN